MPDLSVVALQLAIVALVEERRRAVSRHTVMDPDDEAFEEIGGTPDEIDSVMWEFRDAYEQARAPHPAYPPFDELVAAGD
jgi:hypothetical protein